MSEFVEMSGLKITLAANMMVDSLVEKDNSVMEEDINYCKKCNDVLSMIGQFTCTMRESY